MVTSNSQCDPQRLRQLLDDRLPQQSQDDLARHLESCADCRKELESLAAGPAWWSDAQELLSTVIDLAGTTGADSAATPSIIPAKAGGLPLGFLSPSDDPTKLGRLGPYEIVKVIGRGGMGIVLKGFDAALNRYVAIKVLAPQWTHSEAARRRFAREARAAAAVVHEHVIAIHAVASANEMPYLVMPYIDGISLQDRVDRDGPLELKEILRISVQIAAGLAAAHAQGLVHRDIKPANILLENGVERVLITDFGLARAVDDASFTRSCFIAGTPEYMAPEQANGEFVDHRIDLFSLGSLMYAMCTAQSPFRRETTMGVLRHICEGSTRSIRQLNPDIPLWLEQIIARLHAKNPAQRYQTAAEVAELLGNWLAHVQQPSAYPRPRYPSAQRHIFAGFSGRILQARWAAAAVLLLALAGLTSTEITGTSHLLRLLFGAMGYESATTGQSNPLLENQDSIESLATNETLLEQRIAELEQQVLELQAALSAGNDSNVSPGTLAEAQSQMAQAEEEMPGDINNQQPEQPQLDGESTEQVNQPAAPAAAAEGIDSSLIQINNSIEELNEDLYSDFP